MKNFVSLKINLLLLAALLLLNISCEKQPTRKEQIETVRNSIVNLTLIFKDGKEVSRLPAGTGFFTSERYVATAWHVWRDLAKGREEISETQIQFAIQKSSSTGGNEFTVPITFVAEDQENDLAVFSFNSEDIKKQWKEFVVKPLPLSDRLPEIGDEVLLTGFFDEYIQPFSSVGNVAMISETNFKKANTTFNQAIFSDATSLSGHSGGPLYSFQTRTIIGVNTRVLNPNNDRVRTSIAANSLHLIKLLNQVTASENTTQKPAS